MTQATQRSRTAVVPRPRRSVEGHSPAFAVRPPRDGLGQLADLVRDAVAGLGRVHRSPRLAFIWAVWLVGIVGDAWTSLALLSRSGYTEGNPAAAAGMASIGLPAYVALASLTCLVLALVSTGRPAGPVARTAVLFLYAVAAGKVTLALHNVLVWHGVA